MVDKENNGCALAQNAPCLYSDDVPHGPDWSCCIKRDDNASMLLVKIMEAGTVVYPAGYPDGLPYKQWSRLLTTHREAAAAKA